MGSVGARRQSSASSSGARSPTMTSSSSRDFLSNVSSELNDFAQQTTSLFSDIFGEYGVSVCLSLVLVGFKQVVRIDEFSLFLSESNGRLFFCTYEIMANFFVIVYFFVPV